MIVNFARSSAEAEATAAAVEAAGARAELAPGDVGSDEDCRRIAAIAERFRRVDALFNNAGVTRFARHGDLEALSADDFLQVYQVNVIGAFQMARACRRLLEACPQTAAIVNTSSVAAVAGIGSSIAYAASKGALNTLTLSLARALAPKIRVNAICPGFIDTPWFGKGQGAAVADAAREKARARTPLRAASTADDIAASALFLGGRAARHVTGETLLVDAGLHLDVGAYVAP